MLLCGIGIILIVAGLWLYITLYWDNKNSPAFQEKLKILKEKYSKKEEMSFLDYVNLKSHSVAEYISKFLMLIGFLSSVAGCISKYILQTHLP